MLSKFNNSLSCIELLKRSDSNQLSWLLVVAGPIIEEVSDEEADRLMSGSSRSPADPTFARDVGQQPGTANGEASTTSTQTGPVLPNNAAFGDGLNALKQNPDMMR